MKWELSTIAIALIVASSPGCKDDTLILPMPTSNTYIAYDSSGTPVVQGMMLINIKDSTITGSWRLAKIGSAQNVGPQVGTGVLEGTMHNGMLFINLNPGWVDNNVFLTGKIEHDVFRGSWAWSTIAGPTNGGMFDVRPSRINHQQQ